jgi:hypothetical protein
VRNYVFNYPDWYECIEEEVRDIVYRLRNAGFNTTNSCGHEMWIELNVSHYDLHNLYNILATEWGEFIIEYYWEGTQLYRSWAIIRLGNRNPLKEE